MFKHAFKFKARSILAATALACLAASASTASAEVVERIVAIVNDEIIAMTDLNKFSDRLRSGGLTDDLLIPDDEAKQALLKDRSKMLQKMIDEKIIDSEVKRQNLTVPFERVEQEIRTIAGRNGLGREELKAAIAEKGISFSQYQDFIKTGLERQALISKQVTSKIKISEDDVSAQYATADGGAGGGQSYEYTLSHILFLPDKGGAAAARKRADFVVEKLKAGGNFEKLAAEYSEDPNFSSGGSLGTFRSGEFLKELESAVQKLAAGETTGVVQTRSGLHIVKLVRKKIVPDPKMEREKEKIRSALYEKAMKRQFQAWLDQMRQEAFIRVNGTDEK